MTSTPVAEIRVKRAVAGPGPLGAKGAVDKVEAFRQLAEAELDASYGLASAILGDPVEAEDAVHDAFVTAWRKWSTLRDAGKFEPWFRRIVVNTCRNRLRRVSRHPTNQLPDEPGLGIGDQTGVIHDHAVLDQAFAGLSADDKIVLVLRYFLDLSAEDIATLTDIRPGTVGSRLHRAQARLREALSEHDETGTVR